MRKLIPLAIAAGLATTALAHEGVKNAAVKARMQGMSEIGVGMKVIGQMAQGKTEFDQAAAEAALASIRAQSAMVTALFQANETDPKSEAMPAIWTNWADFQAKAQAMQVAAEGASAQDVNALRQALGALGGTCKSCHSQYRE